MFISDSNEVARPRLIISLNLRSVPNEKLANICLDCTKKLDEFIIKFDNNEPDIVSGSFLLD